LRFAVRQSDGNRVMKTTTATPATGTLYWYMTPGIVAESDLAGVIKSEYVFFGGERVARRDTNSGVFYYFSDHLKTTLGGELTPAVLSKMNLTFTLGVANFSSPTAMTIIISLPAKNGTVNQGWIILGHGTTGTRWEGSSRRIGQLRQRQYLMLSSLIRSR
jgi:hypothetical protein